MMRTHNPTQRTEVFGAAQTWADLEARGVAVPHAEKHTAAPGTMSLQGTINPNLADFGDASEARQYSGRAVEANWTCPFRPRRPR